MPRPSPALEESFHALFHHIAAVERDDRYGVEHPHEQVEPPRPEEEVDHAPEEGERLLPGHLLRGIGEQDRKLLGVALDESVDRGYRQVEWRKKTEVCYVSDMLLHHGSVVVVDSHEPGVPIAVERLRPRGEGEGVGTLAPALHSGQGDDLPRLCPIHDRRHLFLVYHGNTVYRRNDRVAREARIGRGVVLVDPLDKRNCKWRRHPHQKEHRHETREAEDDVVRYSGAEHTDLWHPFRRLHILFIGLDERPYRDDGDEEAHAFHPHILDPGEDGMAELMDDDREEEAENDGRGDRDRLVDARYREKVPRIVDPGRFRGMYQELGHCKEQGECHEDRDHDDQQDAECCINTEYRPELPEPVEKTDPLGLDGEDGPKEHDVVGK